MIFKTSSMLRYKNNRSMEEVFSLPIRVRHVFALVGRLEILLTAGGFFYPPPHHLSGYSGYNISIL